MDVSSGAMYAYAVRSVCLGGESEFSSTVNGTTGINSYNGDEVRIYPNPAHSVLNIEGDNLKEAALYSAIGTMVGKVMLNGMTNSINVSGLSKGVYFVKITSVEGTVCTRKVVIE